MARLSLPQAALLAVLAAPGAALAQKDAGEARPAVMPFGAAALGGDGAAAIGAGLRLFPGPAGGATVSPQPMPAPAATAMPSAPQSQPLPHVKPAAAGAPAVPAMTGKPAPLGAAAGAAGRPAAPPARSPTAFQADPAVSARVRAQVLAAALPDSPDPAALRQAVESGAPWREFDRLLAQHGYDSRDLADVIGAFYLVAWEVATGGDATGEPAGIAAVRGQARGMLAGNPALARMTEPERQATAETLAFHAMAVAARAHDLQAAGGSGLVAFRQEVAAAVAQYQGIDLRRFALTPAGFQPR
ncbi:DUF6683 family protein [Roseomonas sp. HF4]|uniref:DUF6683 family protein n=1 Tax=Roseomonas sp. HF4 TaxID=2562313 RepID=UPI0010C120FD|nr:DUF6683 family protein [Roseomonas sp. HF4]